MDFLNSIGFVALVVSGAVILVVILLRKQFGETEAARLLKLLDAATQTVDLIAQAAQVAVTEVENGLKKYGNASDEELKAEAIRIAAELLSQWGISVDQALLNSLVAMIEAAYQNMKREQEFRALPA